ncbi:MAG: hypothetical protein LBM25_06780 [Bacteroidales bacterium]|jgi:hypothetical protein|nr:hypothetical protein [Bacteroidales bacterium]
MRKISAENFWEWFQEKSEFLMDIDSLGDKAEELLNEFASTLALYSEGISFILGDLTENGRQIIFSAEGDEEYFEDVITLCDAVPILDFWDIVAFLPAKGANVKINYKGYTLKSKDLWFVPMENEDSSYGKVGLQIAIKDCKEDDEDLLIAVYSLIEEMIGEYDCTMQIGYFELCPLPSDPEKEDFIPLTMLPDFISWHISQEENKE